MATQFPPSSPLRDTKGHHDPFTAQPPVAVDRGRNFEYPTPNPSSTLGRSSSPPRHTEDDEPKKVSFAVDKPVERPGALAAFKVTKVPLVAPKFTVGRSSSNAIAIRTRDTSVSRKHLEIETRGAQLAVRCLGHNGFGIIVPKTCGIVASGPHTFQLEIIDSPLDAADVPKSVRLDVNHTEFSVMQHETVVFPRCFNVIIELKSNLLIVNPNLDEEDATEDEMPVLKHQTPSRLTDQIPSSPAVKSTFKITSEESTPIRLKPTISDPSKVDFFTIHHDSPQKVQVARQSTPLNDISNSVPHVAPSRKAQSEEPQSNHTRKPKREVSEGPESAPKKNRVQEQSAEPEVLDASILKDIDNLGEINNVLLNHLAFSRLSSTPISTLRAISNTTSKLDPTQLKTILQELKSVGVIYRVGKDAAGKPLEEEYYYIPEQDDDTERPRLVAAIKGHGGLRSCRRTHKQYYWKKPAPKKKDSKSSK